MVQFAALTYRIVDVRHETYEAIRILDEVHIGTFQTVPRLALHPSGVDESVLRGVATAAIRQGKTSWMVRVKAVA